MVAVLVEVFSFAFVDFPPNGLFGPAVWQLLESLQRFDEGFGSRGLWACDSSPHFLQKGSRFDDSFEQGVFAWCGLETVQVI